MSISTCTYVRLSVCVYIYIYTHTHTHRCVSACMHSQIHIYFNIMLASSLLQLKRTIIHQQLPSARYDIRHYRGQKEKLDMASSFKKFIFWCIQFSLLKESL